MKNKDSHMMDVSINQALGIWSELARAYYRDNGFGTTVAEIYAYRLQVNSPFRQQYPPNEELPEWIVEQNRNAAFGLVTLCMRFEDDFECKCLIDGMHPSAWYRKEADRFTHRVRVEVVRDKRGLA